jgi:hypothetical protein
MNKMHPKLSKISLFLRQEMIKWELNIKADPEFVTKITSNSEPAFKILFLWLIKGLLPDV